MLGVCRLVLVGRFLSRDVVDRHWIHDASPKKATISALRSSIMEQGLYFFPGKDFRHSTPEQEAEWLEKHKTGPAGMIIYRPVGGEPFSARKLLIQVLASFVTALILCYVASLMTVSYWERVVAITLLGLMACSTVGVSYWNWYEFPASFFVAQIVDQVVGSFLAGLVIARVAPRGNAISRPLTCR
jgi:hypothetical protein